jgi:hypothetical protein
MADNDSSIIKPVESLQNIGGLTPTKRREQRKRRQNLQKQNKQQPDDSNDEQDLNSEPVEEQTGWDSDGTGIDYCA